MTLGRNKKDKIFVGDMRRDEGKQNGKAQLPWDGPRL